MVLLAERTTSGAPIPADRLTLQVADIGPDTTSIRCLDWDRHRFDIEFALDNGTTYNSFLIRGDKVALVDTSHAKFRELYRDLLLKQIHPDQLDYLIISHTEPDHSGLVSDVLSLAPHVTIVGAKVAIQFLENMIHQPFRSQVVKSGDRLDLGKGHCLEFVSAPNLHWPDTIFTYDPASGILFTCDAFGMHYCDEHLYDELPHLLETDFQYYYDCLMGPNARSVLMALKRIDGLQIQQVATGHGPLLKHQVSHWMGCYRQWSEAQAKTDNLVVLFYVEGYGHSDRLVEIMVQGIHKTEVELEVVDLASATLQEVRELAGTASAIVIGMPPQGRSNASSTATGQTPNFHGAISTILASAHRKQGIGLFEVGGGEDEPIYPLRTQFQDLGLTEVVPPLILKTSVKSVEESTALPQGSQDTLDLPATLLQTCEEFGTDVGQWVSRDRTIQQIKSLDTNLEKALGRLSGGLYILTAQKGEVSSAMLASWVMQASTTPLGVAIAVAKDRAMESFLRAGDRFVLNVLEEGNSQPLMKHFLTRFPPGADRFDGIKTFPSQQGSPILAEALAYLECEVTSRLESHDHWILYATVQTGRVAKAEGLTAVHHRKVGNHY